MGYKRRMVNIITYSGWGAAAAAAATVVFYSWL